MTCIKHATRLSSARRPRRAGVLLAALAWCLAPWAAEAQTGPQPRLPTVKLSAGFHVIDTELALTPEQQATGMMFRRQMGSNEGMLFVAPDKGIRCFWMRNTFIPLSIAFLDDDGRIVNIADMQPQSDQTHCSTEPVRHALEVNQGWFAKRGIKPGMKIAGPPFRR